MQSVIDYGVGNIGSVVRMIEKAGFGVRIAATPGEILQADKLILPGIGSFDHCMSQLNKRGLSEAIRHKVSLERIPFLGICMGMQLICRGSEEGVLPGLGFIDARVAKIGKPPDRRLKVPHMGWNSLEVKFPSRLFPKVDDLYRFYFVHSYCVVPSDNCITSATANYGLNFCAAIEVGNIFGVQFHPEKSHRFGVELMQRFCEVVA